jgi:hypothetical protein
MPATSILSAHLPTLKQGHPVIQFFKKPFLTNRFSARILKLVSRATIDKTVFRHGVLQPKSPLYGDNSINSPIRVLAQPLPDSIFGPPVWPLWRRMGVLLLFFFSAGCPGIEF